MSSFFGRFATKLFIKVVKSHIHRYEKVFRWHGLFRLTWTVFSSFFRIFLENRPLYFSQISADFSEACVLTMLSNFCKFHDEKYPLEIFIFLSK